MLSRFDYDDFDHNCKYMYDFNIYDLLLSLLLFFVCMV